MDKVKPSQGGFIVIIAIQIVIFILFGIFTRYDDSLLPKDEDYAMQVEDNSPGEFKRVPSYPHFQDIHVMIFVGFAFLMTFLKKYGYSASGFNLFLAALIVQWAILTRGFFESEDGKIQLSLENLIGADIAAAAVLISMGALLGRTTPIQLMIMGLIEIVVFSLNEYFQLEMLKITDAGGSIVVHAFGAYFGLAVSFAMRPRKDQCGDSELEGPTYVSDIFAMIGTLFLWIFWPSFNSALLDGADQERAILNTYLALGAATVTTFAFSALLSHEKKLDMVHVQNSTLAGGVAVGSVCNLLIGPHGALLVGICAGLLSVLGYRYLSPLLTRTLRLHDTCGVHNLHGMPAVLSAIFSCIYAALATSSEYKRSLTEIFPAMMKMDENATIHSGNHTEFAVGGFGRTAQLQGWYQLFGILITVGVALVSGLITGYIIKSPSMRRLSEDERHNDEVYWEVPSS